MYVNTVRDKGKGPWDHSRCYEQAAQGLEAVTSKNGTIQLKLADCTLGQVLYWIMHPDSCTAWLKMLSEVPAGLLCSMHTSEHIYSTHVQQLSMVKAWNDIVELS